MSDASRTESRARQVTQVILKSSTRSSKATAAATSLPVAQV
jgi:hypothetical protein